MGSNIYRARVHLIEIQTESLEAISSGNSMKQDGVSSHFSREARDIFNEDYQCWIDLGHHDLPGFLLTESCQIYGVS